jgi:hypothetical protein
MPDGSKGRRRPHVPPQSASPPKDDFVAKFNKDHFVANAGGRTWVFKEVYDEALKRKRLERLWPKAFKELHANHRIEIGEQTKNVAEAWWQHSARRTYKGGLVFDPSGKADCNPDVYNLWRGFAVQPQKGSWELLKAHILNIICSGNRRNFRYLMRWMARMIQHPELPGEVAVVLKSEGEGAGKGTLANALIHILGRQHGIRISSPKHLVGDFNEHLRPCIFLFADEAFFAGDKRHTGALYALITEPWLMIEGKGLTAEPSPNFLHVLMASNNQWVVPAALRARRWFVLQVSEERIGDHAYFAAIQDELEAGGYEAMLYDLLRLDLADFEVRAVPQTEALQEQKQHSLKPELAWWQDALTRGYVFESELGFDDYFQEWREREATEILYASYLKFAKAAHEWRPMNRIMFGRFLSEDLGGRKCFIRSTVVAAPSLKSAGPAAALLHSSAPAPTVTRLATWRLPEGNLSRRQGCTSSGLPTSMMRTIMGVLSGRPGERPRPMSRISISGVNGLRRRSAGARVADKPIMSRLNGDCGRDHGERNCNDGQFLAGLIRATRVGQI